LLCFVTKRIVFVRFRAAPLQLTLRDKQRSVPITGMQFTLLALLLQCRDPRSRNSCCVLMFVHQEATVSGGIFPEPVAMQ
jgi:hypothetical protein